MSQQELCSDDCVPAIGLSWQLRVLLPDLARPRVRHPAPIPLSALPRDSSGPASTHRAGPSSRDLPPSPVPVLALLLRTSRPAPSVASTTRSPSDRPHNRSAILQQHPVSLPIYERTHIDSVLLQSIAPLRLAPQRRVRQDVEHTPWNPLKPGPHSAYEFHPQVFHVCLDRFEAEELYGDGEPNNSGHGSDADQTGGWTRATCGTQRLN